MGAWGGPLTRQTTGATALVCEEHRHRRDLSMTVFTEDRHRHDFSMTVFTEKTVIDFYVDDGVAQKPTFCR